MEGGEWISFNILLAMEGGEWISFNIPVCAGEREIVKIDKDYHLLIINFRQSNPFLKSKLIFILILKRIGLYKKCAFRSLMQ